MFSQTNLIGVRRLVASSGDPITVSLAAPQLTKEGDFCCEYAIEGIDLVVSGSSVGIDQLQALLLTLRKIGSELDVLSAQRNMTLFQDSLGGIPDHGFPRI